MKREMEDKHKSQMACRDFEEKFLQLQAKMNQHQLELQQAQDRIAELEQQLKESSDAKEALVAQQDELKEMMASLERDKEMGLAQKAELLDEIEKKRAEIEESRAQVDSKEEETRKLREEMEEASERVKEANQKMQETLLTASAPPPAKPPRNSMPLVETLPEISESEAATNGNMVQENNLVQNGFVYADDGTESIVTSPPESRRASMIPPPDYEVSSEVLENLEVRDREPPNYNQANDDLQKELRLELEAARDATVPLDTMERIAEKNRKEERDKFKTLREIRSGFAKRRIDTFENM